MLKYQTVLVIVEYVPISHSPDALVEYPRTERNSKLKTGSLLSTRWIKPIHHRFHVNKSAHLIA